jgi:hypothetical protein
MISKVFDFFALSYLVESHFLQDFCLSNLSYSTAEPLFTNEPLFTKQIMFGYRLIQIFNQMKKKKLFRWFGTIFGSQKRRICVYILNEWRKLHQDTTG